MQIKTMGINGFGWVGGLVLYVVAMGLPAVADAGEESIVRYSTEGTFEEVRSNVEMAIVDRGMVVSGVSEIAEMLNRTGQDLGATRQVYLHAEVVEFCSAVLSRDMMEADPHTIVFCPYSVAIYVLPDEPETVYLAYRRLGPADSDESRQTLEEVDALLKGVVEDSMW
jgi:uncharacterized protein (DUF302 family)